jgi:hypothetical protein
MPTYYVSLTIARPASLRDPALIRLLRDAAKCATCVPFEITVAGLVIEAEPVSLKLLEASLRHLLREQGAELGHFVSTNLTYPRNDRPVVGFALVRPTPPRTE